MISSLGLDSPGSGYSSFAAYIAAQCRYGRSTNKKSTTNMDHDSTRPQTQHQERDSAFSREHAILLFLKMDDAQVPTRSPSGLGRVERCVMCVLIKAALKRAIFAHDSLLQGGVPYFQLGNRIL